MNAYNIRYYLTYFISPAGARLAVPLLELGAGQLEELVLWLPSNWLGGHTRLRGAGRGGFRGASRGGVRGAGSGGIKRKKGAKKGDMRSRRLDGEGQEGGRGGMEERRRNFSQSEQRRGE